MLFNLIEPLLVAFILATAMMISQIGTVVYMLITLGYLMPSLLTGDITKIKVKKYLTLGMFVLAPVVTFMKTWIYCQFTDTKNIEMNPDVVDNVRALIGVWPDQWSKTFLNDMLVFVFAGLLFWHYCS